MSSYQDSKVKFNGAIDKLSEEIDKLTKKAQRATELEAQNQKLQENNSHLENEEWALQTSLRHVPSLDSEHQERRDA